MKEVSITTHGMSFVINTYDTTELVSSIIDKHGTYSKNDITIMCELLREGDYFIDMGANIGWHTLLGSRIVGDLGKVFSFEPLLENYNILNLNISDNNMNNCISNHLAITDKEGTSSFYTSEFNSGDNILTHNIVDTHKLSDRVICTSFDRYIIDNFIDMSKIKLIKMDIQGSEASALDGMKRFIKDYKPAIIIEYAPIHLKMCGASPFDILSFIDRNNYIPFQIREERDINNNEILVRASVKDLVEMTEFLFTTDSWGIDLLLLQKHDIDKIKQYIKD